MKPGKLYKAKEIQYYKNIPFVKVKVVSVENDVVTFSTEYPVRELNCKVEDFNNIFKEWK
jgi:hypothetical protein